MQPKRIILTVTNDLVTDQRVHRSCMALREAGYEVHLVGRRLPGSAPVSRPYATHRMRLLFRKKAVFYAEYNIRLFLRLFFSPADALYANDSDTLPAVYCAARLRHKPLFFDAHEMFPEVPELVGRPRVKAIWRAIEDRYFPRLKSYRYGAACCTVCGSIAQIYEQRYGLKMSVVRNVPMAHDVTDASAEIADFDTLLRGRRLLLYQGAVNVGRGIEWIIDAMPELDDCLFVVAGDGDIINDVRARVREKGLADRVHFLGRQPLDRLHLWTRKADLGMSLLENRGLNYYYSLPNRLADFVQAGVPVLATDFPEIRQVVEGYGVGTLVPDGATQPHQLAQTIRQTLAYWDALPAQERTRRFAQAAAQLSWEVDKKRLLSAVDTIFLKK